MLINFVPINAVCFLLSVGSNVGTKPFWEFECQHLLPLISTLSYVCVPLIGSITFILCSSLMSSNDKPGRQSVDNNHRDASCFSRPSAGFFKCVSCVSLRVAVQRSYLLYWQLDLGYLLNLHSLLTHSQTVGIKVSSVPSVAFCAKSRLKVDKSRLSSHNAGGYVRLRRTGYIDLFALD